MDPLFRAKKNFDHSPLIFHSANVNWGPKPFRAFDDWMKANEVNSTIERVVNNNHHRHFYGILKEIKQEIKSWLNFNGGKDHREISTLERKLQVVDNEGGNFKRVNLRFLLQNAYQREVIQLK